MQSPIAKKIIEEKCNKKDSYFEFREFYKNYFGKKHFLNPQTFSSYLTSGLFPITMLRALSIYLNSSINEKIFTNVLVNSKDNKGKLILSKGLIKYLETFCNYKNIWEI
ncbi:MAG: hypothetical protein NUV57_00970 [archaeon]|nr:hypothetical protein [archaeon]